MNSVRKFSTKPIVAAAALSAAALILASNPVLARGAGKSGPDAANAAACVAAPCNPPRRETEREKDCTCKVTKMKTASGIVYVRDCYYSYSGAVHYCTPSND